MKNKVVILSWAVYIIIAEVVLYGAANNWHLNYWLVINGYAVAMFGWIVPLIITVRENGGL